MLTSMKTRLKSISGMIIASAVIVITASSPALAGKSLTVQATAYNSVPSQTKGDPTLAAWGDRLIPGMKVIAVSRDLLRMGLKHNSRVRIKGLPGHYLVKDKMNKRWKRKIDIYMGKDIRMARNWGKRRVVIYWD